MAVVWLPALSRKVVFPSAYEFIENGGFEAGLEPWKPSLSVYSYCSVLAYGGYEGNYSVKLGPARQAHGPTYCGVTQSFELVEPPFVFKMALMKNDMSKKDEFIIHLIDQQGRRESVVFLFKGVVDTEAKADVTAYLNWLSPIYVGEASFKPGWNTVSILAFNDSYIVSVNENIAWGKAVPRTVKVQAVDLGTTWGQEYEGGSYLVDAVSLLKFLG